MQRFCGTRLHVGARNTHHSANLIQHLFVRHAAAHCGIVAFPNEARAVAVAGQHVAVQAIVGDVGGAALEDLHVDGPLADVKVVAEVVVPPLRGSAMQTKSSYFGI